MNGATSVGAGPWLITRRTGRAHQRKMTDCHAVRLLQCEAGAQPCSRTVALQHPGCASDRLRGRATSAGSGHEGGREGQFAKAGPKKLGRGAHDAAPQRRAC